MFTIDGLKVTESHKDASFGVADISAYLGFKSPKKKFDCAC